MYAKTSRKWQIPINANHAPLSELSFLYDVFSKYTFWWVRPLLGQAALAGKLDMADLLPLDDADQPVSLSARLAEHHPQTGFQLLVTLIFKIQKKIFMSSLVHGWVFLSLMLVDPLLLQQLLQEHSSHRMEYVLALAGSMYIRVCCMEVCYFDSLRVMNNARSAVIQAIFKKSTCYCGVLSQGL